MKYIPLWVMLLLGSAHADWSSTLSVLDRVNYNTYDTNPFNPSNVADIPTLDNTFYGVLDINGYGVVGRFLGGYTSLLITHDDTSYYQDTWEYDALLLYYQRYFGEVHMLVGKQILSWSVSTGVHPLDLFSRTVFAGYDIQNFNLTQEGMPMAMVSFPVGYGLYVDMVYAEDRIGYSWNDTNQNNALQTYAGTSQVAMRLSGVLASFTGSLVMDYQNIEGFGIGASADYGIGRSLAVHGEFFTRVNGSSRGVWDSSTFSYIIPANDTPKTQLAVGLTYTLQHLQELTLTVEYLFNGNGMTNAQYQAMLDDKNTIGSTYPPDIADDILAGMGQFAINPLPMRNYAYIRLAYTSHDFQLVNDAYISLQDGGYWNNLYGTFSILSSLSMQVGWIVNTGTPNSSTVMAPINNTIYATMKWVYRLL